jgi:small subunit ribosomal protein S15
VIVIFILFSSPAAILSVRIQNLHSHLQQHKKDRHNYRELRTMVHQRAKILKYLKSKSLTRYHTCLEQLGLQPRAVEGEIIV